MGVCAVCQANLKITKTNTELRQHAENKHGKTLAMCFPNAEKIAEEMLAAQKGGGKGGKGGAAQQGKSKAKKQKDAADGLDDLLSAGLSGIGKKKKKGGK